MDIFADGSIDAILSKTAKGPQPIIRFEVVTVPHPGLSAEKGYPVHRDIEMAYVSYPGEDKMEQPYKVDEAFKRGEFGPYYERWKKAQTDEHIVDGYKLSEWPVIDRATAADLRYHKVYTVEHLAALSDATVQKLGMGIAELRKKAQATLEVAKDRAAAEKYAVENERVKRENEELKKQIVKFGAMIEDLQKKVDK